jgi:hypothetical protein
MSLDEPLSRDLMLPSFPFPTLDLIRPLACLTKEKIETEPTDETKQFLFLDGFLYEPGLEFDHFRSVQGTQPNSPANPGSGLY